MEGAFWNDLELKPPPTFTFKLTSAEVSFSDLRKLSDVLWDCLTILQNQQPLFTEAATMSRLIYRMKSLFRGDKGFKAVQKVHLCLRHYLSLNLTPIYDNFFRTIPWNSSEKEIYCPTRQMLEHVLLRTQGLAALLCRIVHTCLEAAFLFKSRISCGQHWQTSLLCLGVVSRIWALAKHILTSCVKWYGAMLPFLNVFKPSGPSWLPEGYNFPSDLTKWLDMPWIKKTVSSAGSATDSRGFSSGISSMYEEKGASLLFTHVKPKIQSIHDDLGVSVSRSSLPMAATAPENLRLTDSDTMEATVPITNEEEGEGEVPQREFSTESSKSSKRKLKRKQGQIQSELQEDTACKRRALERENLLTDHADSVNPNPVSDRNENPVITMKTKKSSKCKNINRIMSSIKSQHDVELFLKDETNNRSITSCLDNEQWVLLKKLVAKLNLKLKKTEEEKKKSKILLQIKEAFKIALS